VPFVFTRPTLLPPPRTLFTVVWMFANRFFFSSLGVLPAVLFPWPSSSADAFHRRLVRPSTPPLYFSLFGTLIFLPRSTTLVLLSAEPLSSLPSPLLNGRRPSEPLLSRSPRFLFPPFGPLDDRRETFVKFRIADPPPPRFRDGSHETGTSMPVWRPFDGFILCGYFKASRNPSPFRSPFLAFST